MLITQIVAALCAINNSKVVLFHMLQIGEEEIIFLLYFQIRMQITPKISSIVPCLKLASLKYFMYTHPQLFEQSY